MANVVSLRGEPIVPPGTPNERVIELAEKVMEMARSGDLRGLAVLLYHHDDTHSRRWAGSVSLGTIGNLERLKVSLCNEFENR